MFRLIHLIEMTWNCVYGFTHPPSLGSNFLLDHCCSAFHPISTSPVVATDTPADRIAIGLATQLGAPAYCVPDFIYGLSQDAIQFRQNEQRQQMYQAMSFSVNSTL